MSDAKPKASRSAASEVVYLELNPASGIDVLGDTTPPLLFKGAVFGFTRAEADALLDLPNDHGVPIVREATSGD